MVRAADRVRSLQGNGRLREPKSASGQNAWLRGGIEKETEVVTLVSTPQPPAIPIAPLHPPAIPIAPLQRAGFEKKTEGATLVSTRHRPPAIPIAPLHHVASAARSRQSS